MRDPMDSHSTPALDYARPKRGGRNVFRAIAEWSCCLFACGDVAYYFLRVVPYVRKSPPQYRGETFLIGGTVVTVVMIICFALAVALLLTRPSNRFPLIVTMVLGLLPVYVSLQCVYWPQFGP